MQAPDSLQLINHQDPGDHDNASFFSLIGVMVAKKFSICQSFDQKISNKALMLIKKVDFLVIMF